jgi:hypothetical protein
LSDATTGCSAGSSSAAERTQKVVFGGAGGFERAAGIVRRAPMMGDANICPRKSCSARFAPSLDAGDRDRGGERIDEHTCRAAPAVQPSTQSRATY